MRSKGETMELIRQTTKNVERFHFKQNEKFDFPCLFKNISFNTQN